jgi:ligand-binding sensor domain-containing protein
MNRFITFLFLFFAALGATGQGVVGEWKEYLSFSNAFKVADAGNKVYCATEGGLFYYDLSDNSVNKITRLNGLSDFGIKTIAYSAANKLLLVAYKNSNIDLVYDNNVVNLSDLKRKVMTGDKSINNILFIGNEAYLSCGFGIVVINLEKMEVKDTYLIGPNGSQLNVFDLAVKDNLIYAATESGIYYADLNNQNLLDYRNWSHVNDIPQANEKYVEVEVFAGSLIARYYMGTGDQGLMYIKKTNGWESFYDNDVVYISEIRASGNRLTLKGLRWIGILDANGLETKSYTTYPGLEEKRDNIDPISAFFSETTGLWVADSNYGLVKIGANTSESIMPNGPIDNRAFSLYDNNKDLWVAPGGYGSAWGGVGIAPHFQLFRDGNWTHFSGKEIPTMTNFWDIVCMVSDPADRDHIFVGSWGGGLLEFKDGKLLHRFFQGNSTLQSALDSDPQNQYVRVGGLNYDSKGNLWMTNSEALDVLSVLHSNGSWEKFNLPGVAKKTIGQLIVNQADDKWIVAPRGNNLYVVNSDASKKIYLPVKAYFNNGETELITDMNDIYSIAEDKDGAIWLGTSKGIAVYFNPQKIWETGFIYASQPGLDLKDGLYHPLLATETVTAIAVDGANRKWMGTSNSGVYLISDNGEKEIHHFTEENSPLLSNTITSLAIDQNTGELFIGTKSGIVSYMGEATGGNDDFSNVMVYPNPVRETYDGPVVISGLVEESDVKITDISGNLVFKTTSLGGRATWDGKTLNGNRASTGVYLIFLSDKTGDKTHISKLLFVH